jgi:hypothetical protein
MPGNDGRLTGCAALLGPLREQENIRVKCLVPSWVAPPGPKEYWESLTPEEGKERGVPETLIQLDQIADTILRLVTDESLFGRIMVWWNGEPPRLIPVGDPVMNDWNEPTVSSRNSRQEVARVLGNRRS